MRREKASLTLFRYAHRWDIPWLANGSIPARATPQVSLCNSEVHSASSCGQDFHQLPPALWTAVRGLLVLFDVFQVLGVIICQMADLSMASGGDIAYAGHLAFRFLPINM